MAGTEKSTICVWCKWGYGWTCHTCGMTCCPQLECNKLHDAMHILESTPGWWNLT